MRDRSPICFVPVPVLVLVRSLVVNDYGPLRRDRTTSSARSGPSTIDQPRLTFANPVQVSVEQQHGEETEEQFDADVERTFAKMSKLRYLDFFHFSDFSRQGALKRSNLQVKLFFIPNILLIQRLSPLQLSRSFSNRSYLATLVGIAADFLQFDEAHGGRAGTIWPQLIGIAFPHLRGVTLLKSIECLLERCLCNREMSLPEEDGLLHLLDYVEFCSGNAALSKALIAAGYVGASFDIQYDPVFQDMLHAFGLRLFIDAVCASRTAALMWLGTKCSSFVSLCLSLSKRYEWNSFYGDESRGWVYEGNCQCEVSCFLMMLSALLSCKVALEQPISSRMVLIPSMFNLLNFVPFGFHKTITYMGAFGGSSTKCLQIWHNTQVFDGLRRPRPDSIQFATPLAIGDGNSYTGVKNLLESSEHYTKQFGESVARLYRSG